MFETIDRVIVEQNGTMNELCENRHPIRVVARSTFGSRLIERKLKIGWSRRWRKEYRTADKIWRERASDEVAAWLGVTSFARDVYVVRSLAFRRTINRSRPSTSSLATRGRPRISIFFVARRKATRVRNLWRDKEPQTNAKWITPGQRAVRALPWIAVQIFPSLRCRFELRAKPFSIAVSRDLFYA